MKEAEAIFKVKHKHNGRVLTQAPRPGPVLSELPGMSTAGLDRVFFPQS